MIECAHCESSQFLQIYKSKVRWEEGEELVEVVEHYRCTTCDVTGKLHRDLETTVVSGDVRENNKRPDVELREESNSAFGIDDVGKGES